MQTFLQFLTENAEKAKRTLDFIKSRPENEMSAPSLQTHDRSMWNTISARSSEPIHHQVIDKISEMDPDLGKSHTERLHNWWSSRDFKHEDAPHVKETMKTFIDNKKRLGNVSINGKKGSNINSYESFHHLDQTLDAHIRHKREEIKGSFSHPDAPEIHNKDGLIVHELKTKESSIHTRKCFDNKWCTSRNDDHNMFDNYNKKGNLYHVQTPDKNHWQFHFEHSEFADHNNKYHTPEKLVRDYPQLKEVSAFKDHYLKSIPFAKDDGERHKMIDDHLQHHGGSEFEDSEAIVKHGTSEQVDRHYEIPPSYRIDRSGYTSSMSSRGARLLADRGDHHHLHAILDAMDNKDFPHYEVYRHVAGEASYQKHHDIIDRLQNHKNPRIREIGDSYAPYPTEKRN